MASSGWPPLPVRVRERDVGVRRVGPPRDDAVQHRDRLLTLPVLVQLGRRVQVAVDLDEALRIVRLGVDRPRGRAARDVAERLERGGRVRGFAARADSGGSTL